MSAPHINGRAAFVFDEPNFDVDRIIGFDALRAHNFSTMRAAAMSAFDSQFAERVKKGDVLVGGRNFGYGHPHGPPMAVMRSLGIAAVIADSFAPLYLMGELAAGFPQITCPGVSAMVSRWDHLEIDWDGERLVNRTTSATLVLKPLSKREQGILAAGGLLSMLRNERA